MQTSFGFDITRCHFLQECRVGMGKMALASLLGMLALISSLCAGNDDKTTIASWTLRVHSKGKLVSEHLLDPSNADDLAMCDSIESWLKKSDSGRLDLNSYAPSVVIESDLHKIQFGAKRVVISSRATKDKTWNQKSRPANDEDKNLRDRLTAFAQAKK